MTLSKKITLAPSLASGIVAATLVFTDSLVAPLFVTGASFTWMAFISWTVFSFSAFIDRIKAVIGYAIGFAAANLMVFIGTNLSNEIGFRVININLATLIGVFIVNFIIMFFDKATKWFLDSLPGIFVGMTLTFSGAGISMPMDEPKLLVLILVYGIFGLLCGLAYSFLVEKINARLNKN